VLSHLAADIVERLQNGPGKRGTGVHLGALAQFVDQHQGVLRGVGQHVPASKIVLRRPGGSDYISCQLKLDCAQYMLPIT
jgi:hypothetical protein